VTILTDAVGKLDLTVFRLSPFPSALSVLNSFAAFSPLGAFSAYPSCICDKRLLASWDLRFVFKFTSLLSPFFGILSRKKVKLFWTLASLED